MPTDDFAELRAALADPERAQEKWQAEETTDLSNDLFDESDGDAEYKPRRTGWFCGNVGSVDRGEYNALSASDAFVAAAAVNAAPALLAAKDAAERRLEPIPREARITAADLTRQREWSTKTFGPGARTGGVLAHIRKELIEIEQEPGSLEWIDVLILALDGAWRAGYAPSEVIAAYHAKMAVNFAREWPDWRGRSESEAIEHVRDDEPCLCERYLQTGISHTKAEHEPGRPLYGNLAL